MARLSAPDTREPVLTVQVDVDGLHNLLAFYGFEPGTSVSDQIVYRLALPRFAELFEACGVHATFFVIGEDLHDRTNQDMVRQLHVAGHEIANHTQTHPYHFNQLSPAQKHREIAQADQAIAHIIGQKPVGFRAPGYDVDRDVLESLAQLDYHYDSSVMPSILNLPSKVIHRFMSQNRSLTGYGSMALSFAPNRPYRPNLDSLWRPVASGTLWEVPVTCVPCLRLPFYANFNLFTGDALFQMSSRLAARRDCNYVFHAVELLDPTEIDSRLHRHPNARLPLTEKMSRCRRFLQQLKRGRRVLLSKAFAVELDGT